ncbi:Hypothetical predicted protein, partial [Paramuricea clavata]
MPRLTRNSRESGPVFSGVVSSERSSSDSPTSIGATSSASTTTNTVVQSGTSTMPALSTGDIVTNVVQVLQGQLNSLVQNAIDAQLSSSASGSSSANCEESSQAQLSTATSRTASFVHNLATSAGNFSTLGSAPFRSSATSEASTGMPRMVSCLANSTGRIIPNFLNTFTAPISSSVWSSGGGYSTPEVALASKPSVVPLLPSVLDLAGYSSEQSLPQSLHGHGPSPFIVGPGYAPISAKIVNAIVSGKFTNLGDLLPENALVVDDFSEPHILLDGRLVLTGSARKPRKEITDILSWVEAFTVFSVIVCSYFPNRWRDLSSYKLLILRTYRQ